MRSVVRRLGWGVVALGVLVAWLSVVEGEWFAFVPLVQAAAPAGAVCALVVALVMLLWSWRQAAAMGLVAVVLYAPMLPDLTSRHPSVPVPAGERPAGMVTVLSVNTYFGIEVPARTVEQVRWLRPDVLVLVEESPQNWAGLQREGLGELMPYATGTIGGSSSTVVVSREPVECVELSALMRCNEVVDVTGVQSSAPDGDVAQVGQFDMPVVRLRDGTLFRGIHQWSPRLDPVNRWYRDQRALTEWVRARADEPRLVLAGDFNASRSHPIFRRMVTPMASAPSGGVPWTRTWPMGWFFPPFVQIDHVVAQGFGVAAAGVLPSKVSDHAAVWAQLSPK